MHINIQNVKMHGNNQMLTSNNGSLNDNNNQVHASTLAPLQRAQNVAARLVLRLDHRAHIKPALQRLHWLPAKARIQFKIATVMHATLNQRGPAYLNNIIKFNTEEAGRRQRRCCHEDTDSVREARLLRLRSKYLEPDSSSRQERSFCPGYS